MHVCACLLLCIISMFSYPDLGFTMLLPSMGLYLSVFGATCLHGCLRPSCGLFGCNCLQDTSLWCWCAWCIPFSTPCGDVMLALLALCHPFGFLYFFEYFMLTYMFRHESVCRPYSNPMELWTSDPNLQLSILLASFPSIYFFACLLPYFLCLCMYTLEAMTLGVKAWPLRHKQ